MSDAINPSHYKHLPVEAIDIIMAAIAKAPSNEAACLHWQVLKYTLRCWEKKGIEDLRKAKWYLDRLVDSFDSLLAEINAPILEGESEKPKPSKDRPPSGYRMLGDAKIEPRCTEDLYWSDSNKHWAPIGFQMSYANQHNWAACRKIYEPSKRYREPPNGWRWIEVGEVFCDTDSTNTVDAIPSGWIGTVCAVKHVAFRKIEELKRYREPTLEDLKNGPIECEYRDYDDEQWRSGLLVYMLEGAQPFVCVSKDRGLSGQWLQCRIEVQE